MKSINPYAVVGLAIIFTTTAKMTIPDGGGNSTLIFGFIPLLFAVWCGDKYSGVFAVLLFTVAITHSFFPPKYLIITFLHLAEIAIIAASLAHIGALIKNRITHNALLQHRHDRLQEVCETFPHLVWLSPGPEFTKNITYLNGAWAEYTGIPTHKLIDQGYITEGIIHPNDMDIIMPRWKEWMDKGTPFHCELRIRRADGEFRWHFAKAVPYLDENKNIRHWLGTCTDIHEERDAMHRLACLTKRKDDFLATLSHELRNPLTPVLACLAVLRRYEHPPHVKTALDIIERQVRVINRLVDDLLDVSRLHRNKFHLMIQAVDLTSVVLLAAEMVRPTFAIKKQHFKVNSPPTPVFVDGDHDRLVQVVGNLLTNASKYTDNDGNIVVTVARKEGTTAVLTVEDNGVGIEQAMQPHIFTLFSQVEETVRRSQGGLGIGLSLVKGLVEQHRGNVSVYSEGKGRGSIFTVTLPLAHKSLAGTTLPNYRRADGDSGNTADDTPILF